MKQIIIFLLVIILALISYGKYNQFKRYNAPEVNYTTDTKIDKTYYNRELLLNYHEAIEDLNSYVMLQWTANDIDVRTPEDDDIETKNATEIYAKKLGKVKFYEQILNTSYNLKQKGLSNKEVQFLEKEGLDLETYKTKAKFETIKNLFNKNTNLYNGEKNAIIYEVQKRLKSLGYSLELDGVYRVETLNAIKSFEEKQNLLADGYLDELTIELLFK